jgi:hypothetical protein
MRESPTPIWCDDEGRPLPGAPLLAAHALWLEGPPNPDRREEVARALGFARAEIDAACEFHARVLAGQGGTLQLCLGLSCRVDGAAAFHARLIQLFGASAVAVGYETVHCLGHCLEGPNVAFRRETFCTKSCTLVEDRPWRPADAGPRVCGAKDAPPVLD